MTRATFSVVRVVVVALLGVMLSGPAAWAAVTLSVRSVRGGLDLDFGTIAAGEASRTEELELAVTNTGSAQYRIYQEFPDLLVNERGDRLPEGRLMMQLARGVTGTRATDGIVAVTQSPQELFVSGASGTSEVLLVAYSLSAAGDLPAGSYRGVLRFTVEALDTGAIVTETITVRAAVSTVFGLERADVTPDRIQLGEVEPGARSSVEALPLRIINNTASPTQVTQELVQPLTNGRGDTLAMDALAATVTSSQGIESWRPVVVSPEVVLTDERGELREVRLAYAATIPADQPAGTYQGALRIRLSNLSTSAADERLLPVEVVVSELFTMAVKSMEDASGRLHFSPPSADAPVERTMVVDIRTNMRRPYQVLAGLDHALVLETGETLPPEAFVWSIPKTERGTSLVASNSPVTVGYEPVYQSDANGSPDSFVLACRLTIPPDARDGLYSGQLQFTITTF